MTRDASRQTTQREQATSPPETLELTALVADLVAVDSVNPALVPGGAGEEEIGKFVAQWLREAGCEVFVEPVSGPRANVVARVTGRGGGRTLMLNAHMDTVGVSGMPAPHTPVFRNGRLYGRGAGDTKAGLAAGMWALRAASRGDRLRGDLILTAVIDEEAHSKGTDAVARRWSADAAIVLEPTRLEIRTAHKGFVWLTLTVNGIAAHGSRPELGVDAIAKIARIIVEIEQLGVALAATPGHPFVGPGSVHCSLISGGSELSSYPAHASLQLERRTTPGESVDHVLRELQEIIDRVRERDPSIDAQLRVDFSREPLSPENNEAIASLLASHVGAELGTTAVIASDAGWTDAALLTERGIPSVVFGPAGYGSHANDESVDLRSVGQVARILESVAREFCA